MYTMILIFIMACSMQCSLLFGQKSNLDPARYSIVLVHIGNELPAYIIDCIEQIQSFNASAPLYLLANHQALASFKRNALSATITMIALESLHKTMAHEQFLLRTTLPEGFWRSASERFLYLDDFVQQYAVEQVIHLENDVMVYVDFSELMPILENKYPALAATFDNDQRCIPSIVYSAHQQALHPLAQFFADHAHSGKCDMEIIALFKAQHEAAMIDSLPIIMPSYHEHYTLVSPHGHTTHDVQKYSRNFVFFESLFDAAALGQYLGGIDPRNGPSLPGFINESCLFNPAYLTYTWSSDNRGRLIPHALFKGEKYRINNLHIHAKNLHRFSSTNASLSPN